MKILVISRTPWREDNSFGNSYSNILNEINDAEIYNVCLADGFPDFLNHKVKSVYKISERLIIKSFFNKKINNIGERIDRNNLSLCDQEIVNDSFNNKMNYARKKRYPILFYLREVFWKYGRINYYGIIEYIKNISPDVMFVPAYNAVYVSRIALYIKKNINIPMVTEASIDIYTLKQISFDPFFWINRFCVRKYTRQIVKNSVKMYVISEKMKKDYEKLLKITCEVLYKYPNDSRKLYDYTPNNELLKFVYTGNIGSNRWKTLSFLGKEIYKNNKGKLTIYTDTPLSLIMKVALRHCTIKNFVSSKDILKIQNDADILVHAESFDIKDKLHVRYSISTKIMDYISCERCIVALGPRSISSIDMLNQYGIAIIIDNKNKINKIVRNINNNLIMECISNIKKYKNNVHEHKINVLNISSSLKSIIKDNNESFTN